MLKQGRCNDDGYSLLEVMTVLVLVGLVVGLASGAFSFVVNAYSREVSKHGCSRKRGLWRFF